LTGIRGRKKAPFSLDLKLPRLLALELLLARRSGEMDPRLEVESRRAVGRTFSRPLSELAGLGGAVAE